MKTKTRDEGVPMGLVLPEQPAAARLGRQLARRACSLLLFGSQRCQRRLACLERLPADTGKLNTLPLGGPRGRGASNRCPLLLAQVAGSAGGLAAGERHCSSGRRWGDKGGQACQGRFCRSSACVCFQPMLSSPRPQQRCCSASSRKASCQHGPPAAAASTHLLVRTGR